MSRREAETIEVSVTFKRFTAHSVMVNDGDRDVWLPLSQVDYDFCDTDEGEVIELLMPEWLAKEKGMI